MSSSILHQCPSCGHVSDISQALAAFIENPHCTQCGMSASESNTKIQDELSSLFDRQMSMTMAPPSHTTNEVIPTPSYSITQHYHHSTHVASSSAPASSITPPTTSNTSTIQADQSMAVMIQNIHDVLRHHALDPTTFSPEQLELFKNADPAQQQRLIQTWQFYSAPQIQASSSSQDFEMDDSMVEVEAQPVEYQYHDEHAEPYMASGYQVEAASGHGSTLPAEPSTGRPYDSSTDPVYSGQQWWEMPRTTNTTTSSMESQYGMFEEMSRYHSVHGMGMVQPQGCYN